jgi:hypothetical protein
MQNLAHESLAAKKAQPLNELNAPMTGKPLGGSQTVAPAVPQNQMVTEKPEAKASDKTPQIGDSVIVAEENDTYQAKVKSMKDGRYTLSFGDKKPPQARDYQANELRLVDKAQSATESLLKEDGEEVPDQKSSDAPGQEPKMSPGKKMILGTGQDPRELPEAEFELIDIGIDNSQYFQGIGSGVYDEVFVGIGDNPAEALNDALDSAASAGWNVEHINEEWPDKPSVADELRDQARNEIDEDQIRDSLDDPSDEEAFKEAMDEAVEEKLEEMTECDLYYYAAVRLRVAGSEAE